MILLTPNLERNIYEHARMLIEDGWCQGDYAQDDDGKPLYVHSPPAPRYFSLSGALYQAVHLAGAGRFYAVLESNLTELLNPRQALEEFNDAPTTTKQSVIKLLNQVIAARTAEKQD